MIDTTELQHCKIIRDDEEKDAAILFEIDGDKYWIPRSRVSIIHTYPGLPVYCDIEIPVWLYEKIF